MTSSPRATTSRARRWSGSGTPTPPTPPSAPRSPPRPTRPRIEQLRGLPPTLLLVDEVDPLRDEGEAYAAKLRLAGVAVTTVRYDGVVHDFMLLNAMSEANATRAAIAQAVAFLRRALGNGPMTDTAPTSSPGSLKRTELQHNASSIPGREIVQVLTEIPAGVESGWHQHPGEEVGYILAGTVQMHLREQPMLTLHAGDPFLIPPRTPHNAIDLGPETGRMLSTYIVEPDQPLATFVR